MLYDNLTINEKGHLAVGGIDTSNLAAEFGTPLYVLDEDVIRAIEPATPHVFNAHGERTMTSPPIPVKYVKQPFLHEKLRIEDAFEKKGGVGGFFSKLFG